MERDKNYPNAHLGLVAGVVQSDGILIKTDAKIHWYEWGDEPDHCVSVGRYENGEWVAMGIRPKTYAEIRLKATNHCPYN